MAVPPPLSTISDFYENLIMCHSLADFKLFFGQFLYFRFFRTLRTLTHIFVQIFFSNFTFSKFFLKQGPKYFLDMFFKAIFCLKYEFNTFKIIWLHIASWKKFEKKFLKFFWSKWIFFSLKHGWIFLNFYILYIYRYAIFGENLKRL